MEVKTTSAQQTQKLGQNFAQKLHGGKIIALYGALGAGKTTFIQGIAAGLKIKRRIISPSFIFIRSYPFVKNHRKLILHHLDLYRSNSTSDLEGLGLDEIISKNSIVILEWADRAKRFLPKKRIDIFIDVIDERIRKFRFKYP